MQPKVLIVDDDELSPVLLGRVLGDQFAFEHAGSGETALAAVSAVKPAIILMDVEMPGGMSGYDACRAIKHNPASAQVPVFFLSAHTEAEDRLKAYESGGDDYISKPFNTEEIRHKLTLALAHQARRNELADKAHRAASMAMTSIREAASVGLILGFLGDIVRQTDHAQIADSTLRTLERFQMQGAVQLRNGGKPFSRNSAGECTAVEQAVLAKMAGENRIVDLGDRSAFNYERATIIAYNMPLHDPGLYGRLKDTVVKMAEALDIHMRSLDGINAAIERGDALLKLAQRGATLAREASARVKIARGERQRALEQIAAQIEIAAPGEAQQRLRETLARETRAQAQAAHHDGLELEKLLNTLVSELEAAEQKASPATPAANGPRFNSVELF